MLKLNTGNGSCFRHARTVTRINLELLAIRTFETGIDAHILRTKLASEGIQSFIFDENIVTLNPLYNLVVGGIKVMVAQADFVRAQQIIAKIDATSPTDENGQVINCPTCGSTELYHAFKSMRGFTGFLSAILSFLLTVIPPYFKTVYKCKECGREFDKKSDAD